MARTTIKPNLAIFKDILTPVVPDTTCDVGAYVLITDVTYWTIHIHILFLSCNECKRVVWRLQVGA